MLLSRDELIATLFRETDRAQRIKTSLALLLCWIDGPDLSEPPYDRHDLDDAIREVGHRTFRLLRCYDSVGQISEREFGLVLPGCNSFNAVSLAERLKIDVFGSPVMIAGKHVRLAACFGIAGSGGRSSLAVFRNAEQALKSARATGPGSIERCACDTEPDAASFLMPVTDSALHW